MNHHLIILTSFVAFLVTTLVFPKILRFAKHHHIEDSPNARKLQRYATPVFGGVAVFLEINPKV
jgi:UDP-N-acetylmuramyl pentapeptide phosphotransferase/UDP-N-acetylglucosamine-1-phosphate transferase